MSTFGGKIEEIPGLSIDRFDGENVHSSVYFLSHCHTDHMRGLFSNDFQTELLNKRRFLYLSSVSAEIMRRLIPNISTQLKELPLELATHIPIGDSIISVTCIPAGHCPGSIMFLLETRDSRVLYTGDYRIGLNDISKFKCFYNAFGGVETIDKVYLDTTFFLESYKTLPKREHSLKELCKIILSWISQNPDNCVKVAASARYGYEYAFKEIYKVCKMPVHVDFEVFKFYSAIPELDGCVTTNGAETQIHSCYLRAQEICAYPQIEKLRIVKLSAFRWQNRDFEAGISELGEDGMFYVCYSTHASYEEGLALINFLQPKDIHICVEHNDIVAMNKLKTIIKEQLLKINFAKEDIQGELFDVQQTEGNYKRKKIGNHSILDSPPH